MSFDPNRRFVRVVREREGGFIEFEFAVGDAGTMVELVMPLAAFEEFCGTQRVELLAAREAGEGPAAGARDAGNWRLSDAMRQQAA